MHFSNAFGFLSFKERMLKLISPPSHKLIWIQPRDKIQGSIDCLFCSIYG